MEEYPRKLQERVRRGNQRTCERKERREKEEEGEGERKGGGEGGMKK